MFHQCTFRLLTIICCDQNLKFVNFLLSEKLIGFCVYFFQYDYFRMADAGKREFIAFICVVFCTVACVLAQDTELLQRSCINLTVDAEGHPKPDADIPVFFQTFFDQLADQWMMKNTSSDDIPGILENATPKLTLIDVFGKITHRIIESSLHWWRIIRNMTDIENVTETQTEAQPGNRPRLPHVEEAMVTPKPQQINVPMRAKLLRELAFYGILFFSDEQQQQGGIQRVPPPFEEFLSNLLQVQISHVLMEAFAYGMFQNLMFFVYNRTVILKSSRLLMVKCIYMHLILYNKTAWGCIGKSRVKGGYRMCPPFVCRACKLIMYFLVCCLFWQRVPLFRDDGTMHPVPLWVMDRMSCHDE